MAAYFRTRPWVRSVTGPLSCDEPPVFALCNLRWKDVEFDGHLRNIVLMPFIIILPRHFTSIVSVGVLAAMGTGDKSRIWRGRILHLFHM